MIQNSGNLSPAPSSRTWPTEIGLVLVVFGVLLLVDQYLHTSWLSSILPFILGLLILFRGILHRQVGFLIAGGVVSGLGAGIFAAFSPWLTATLSNRLGIVLLLHGIGWGLIFFLSRWVAGRSVNWAMVPTLISVGLGLWFFLRPIGLLELVLYIPTAVALTLLICGLIERMIGLIIPGCIVLTIGPGVYAAWGHVGNINGLTQTGQMLVIFALGWGLITIFSRFLINRFVWWPLIPGGVLAMVGWGLYIGGDPSNALGFIGNTGSVGLIIFGIYLLLWRTEFNKTKE